MTRTELRALASRATPGPWVSVRSHSYCGPHVRSDALVSAVVYGRSWSSSRDGADDVAFIAAANPHHVTQLLDELERYAKALESIRDCDWTITLPDRMDAVRDIARTALADASQEVKP